MREIKILREIPQGASTSRAYLECFKGSQLGDFSIGHNVLLP